MVNTSVITEKVDPHYESLCSDATKQVLDYLFWKFPDTFPAMVDKDIDIVYSNILTIIYQNTKPKTYWQRFKEWLS